MLHVVLFQPEIPPNTGNIIRLCANSGAALHLIHPLGFDMEDRQLRRAGLDYHEWARVAEHDDFERFLATVQPTRLLACSTRAAQRYDHVRYADGDALLFGPETRGLPESILAACGERERVRIPMVAGNRSLNLSNAVAVILFEAWRQLGFDGAA